MKKITLEFLIPASLLIFSCGGNQSGRKMAEVPDSLIMITGDQFRAGKMQTGEIRKTLFEDQVRCSGIIVSTASGTARISSAVPGLVKGVRCVAGQKITAGQPLFELTGNEFIELQKDLAENASQLKRITSEYERVNSLYKDKVSTEKEHVMAESEYTAAKARYSALKMKVMQLGLDPSRIEQGDFYETFLVKSPIGGYISQIHVSLGQYIDQQTTMAEIYDPYKLRLRLSFFEKDLGLLREGLPVRFIISGNDQIFFSAKLLPPGKNVNEETKSIFCYAEIDEKAIENLVNNAFVEAIVTVKSDSSAAVPDGAILKSDQNSYILEVVKEEDNNYFVRKINVETGRTNGGLTEIKDLRGIKKIITAGAYEIRP